MFQTVDNFIYQIYTVGESEREAKVYLRKDNLITGGEYCEIVLARFQTVRSQIRSLRQILLIDHREHSEGQCISIVIFLPFFTCYTPFIDFVF